MIAHRAPQENRGCVQPAEALLVFTFPRRGAQSRTPAPSSSVPTNSTSAASPLTLQHHPNTSNSLVGFVLPNRTRSVRGTTGKCVHWLCSAKISPTGVRNKFLDRVIFDRPRVRLNMLVSLHARMVRLGRPNPVSQICGVRAHAARSDRIWPVRTKHRRSWRLSARARSPLAHCQPAFVPPPSPRRT